jgi:hypothetical protein
MIISIHINTIIGIIIALIIMASFIIIHIQLLVLMQTNGGGRMSLGCSQTLQFWFVKCRNGVWWFLHFWCIKCRLRVFVLLHFWCIKCRIRNLLHFWCAKYRIHVLFAFLVCQMSNIAHDSPDTEHPGNTYEDMHLSLLLRRMKIVVISSNY